MRYLSYINEDGNMSSEGIAAFLERALNDEGFQLSFKADPDEALSQFDLTDEEISAIKNGGREHLRALGLDERLSK